MIRTARLPRRCSASGSAVLPRLIGRAGAARRRILSGNGASNCARSASPFPQGSRIFRTVFPATPICPQSGALKPQTAFAPDYRIPKTTERTPTLEKSYAGAVSDPFGSNEANASRICLINHENRGSFSLPRRQTM